MRPVPETTAILKVEIPDRVLAGTLLTEWTEQAGLCLSILRARVTAEAACYELQVEGSATQVARMVRKSAPWDVSRRLLAGAPA